MNSYNRLRKNIEEVTNTDTTTDIWLKDETVNSVLADAKSVSVRNGSLVLTFDNDVCITLVREGYLVCAGCIEAYWLVETCGTYEHKYFAATGDKCTIVL